MRTQYTQEEGWSLMKLEMQVTKQLIATEKAENEIIKMCQARNFWKEIEAINARNRVPSTSSIHQLDPFLDKDGVLRVGERLVKSNLSHEL